MKKLILFLIAMLCGLTVNLYAYSPERPVITGTWSLTAINDSDATPMKVSITHTQKAYTFVSSDCTEKGTYTISNGTITYTIISTDGESASFCGGAGESTIKKISVDGKTLSIRETDGSVLKFTRTN